MRLLIALAALCAMPLCAATLTVTNLNDAGAGSLRDTIAAAATGDDIVFDASLAGGTLTLATGQIAPGGKALTITGLTTAGGKPDITISGNDSSRIFNQTAALTLNNLRLLDGHMAGGPGGAINNSGTAVLTCTNCVFESCRTSSTSAMGGAIHGHVGTLMDCAFMGNSTPNTHAGGALSLVTGTVAQIVRCTFEANSSGFGGAIYVETVANNSTLEIENSTFSGNQSTNAAGYGGAIAAAASAVTSAPSVAIELSFCTFADNSATAVTGGQCFSLSSTVAGSGSASASATFHSCILTDSLTEAMFRVATSGPGATAGFSSTGFNVCSDSPTWMNSVGEQPGTDPLLLPIADNGGLTRTHAIPATSPALDAGAPTSSLTTDQRGLPRLNPDVGAFELQFPIPAVTYDGVPVNDGGYAAVTTLAEVGTALSETCVFTNGASATVDLTLTVPITISGELNCTASVTTQPAATLAPGASSNVVLSITPTAEGLFSFTVTVGSNTLDGSYSYDVIGYAVAPGGGGGGGGVGDDNDQSCTTGTSQGLVLLLGLGALLIVASRGRRGCD